MPKEHIVKSYDEELARLERKISKMTKTVETQLTRAVEALIGRDLFLAKSVVRDDEKVNELQRELESQTVKLLALRQPMARDLRAVIAGLKTASDLERIGDYAANIALHVKDVNNVSLEKPLELLIRMGEIAAVMLSDVIEAYQKMDIQKAIEVWHCDDKIDGIYADLLREIRECMAKDAQNIKAYTGLIFVARCCERIGDHVTNVAENIYFVEEGDPYHGEIVDDQERPK
jgi:phosphate transport system protein